jgi:hypothetical protein
MCAAWKVRRLLLALVLVFTCAPDIDPWLRTPGQRAVLFGGVSSYVSPKEAETRLSLSRSRSVRQHHGRSRGCLSRSFRYRVQVVTVDEATDQDCAGKLVLTFLNGKLVKTVFTPIRPEVYLSRLLARKTLTAVGSSGRRRFRLAGAPPHTRVEVRRTRDTVTVQWSDTRLLKAYWEVQSRGSSRYMK